MNRRDLIARFQSTGFSPAHRLGQNFLVDRNLAVKLVEMSGVVSGDTVVEVGPGFGMLSRVLVERGAVVHAIEKDERLKSHLEGLSQELGESFRWMMGDAVDHPYADLGGSGDCLIVANLPYAITGPWLFKVMSLGFPKVIGLMLQREAAERLMAPVGDKRYGPLGIQLQAAYGLSGMHRVPSSCFHPPPDIESVLFVVKRRENPRRFGKTCYAGMQEVFTQRRKQLAGLLTRKGLDVPRWMALLEKHGLDSRVRPEEVPLAAWIEADELALFGVD